MIKFFRQIRQQTLNSGQMKKPASPLGRYSLYAIGEILLVVIGILIALQINNWNESRKDRKKESYFLNDIMNDLQQDTMEINQIVHRNRIRLSFFQLIDPDFSVPEDIKIFVPDTTLIFRRLFSSSQSFRPTKGSYNSMIADGQSQLIRNRELFNRLQDIYDRQYLRMQGLLKALTDYQHAIIVKRNYEIKYPPFNNISEITDKKIIADLSSLHDYVGFYTRRLINHKKAITEAIQIIEKELQN